jgi:hypothetical protein
LKKALQIALVLLLVAGAYGLYREFRGLNAKLEELKQVDAAAQQTIASANADIKALNAENALLRAKDAIAEIEKAALRAEDKRKAKEIAQLREDLKTAPPETVLATVQGYLNTTEIWLRSNAANQVEAVFSLAAFRLDADVLAEHHYFKFSLIPSIQEQLGICEGQLVGLRTENSNKDRIIIDKDLIITEKEKQIFVRDDTIKYMKKARLWRDLRNVGYGVLLDRILSLVFHGK